MRKKIEMDKKLKTRTTHFPFDQRNVRNGGRQIRNFRQVFAKIYEN